MTVPARYRSRKFLFALLVTALTFILQATELVPPETWGQFLLFAGVYAGGQSMVDAWGKGGRA